MLGGRRWRGMGGGGVRGQKTCLMYALPDERCDCERDCEREFRTFCVFLERLGGGRGKGERGREKGGASRVVMGKGGVVNFFGWVVACCSISI